MLPNVRLMVVAILAAIAGIGCGLGLFATFRVNHEPLARLAEGSPPLQLAFDNRALGSDARLQVNGAGKPISVPVIIDTPNPAPVPSLVPSLVPNLVPGLVPERSGADAATTGNSSDQQAAAGAAAADQSRTASLAVVVAAEQFNATSEAPGQQEAVAAVTDQQPAAVAVTPTAEQRADLNAAAEDQEPAAKSAKSGASKAAKPVARATRGAPARRAAKTVRPRRAVAKVAAQPTYQYPQATYSQPTYTWADGAAQVAQPVKQIRIKRHRAATKTTPAQPNASAATAGLSGTQ